MTSALAVLVTATGCGGSFTDSDPAGSTITSSRTTTATTTRSTTPTAGTTASSGPSAAATTTNSTATNSTATSGTASGPLDSGAAGRILTLADFFQPSDSWIEKRFTFAGQEQVQGIGARVSCGDNPQELELRLGNNFETLTFSVAQSDLSQDSDQRLSVEVLTNNAQADIRSVPFNTVQPFSIQVGGVNALLIRFELDRSGPGCSGSVDAVVSDVSLQ